MATTLLDYIVAAKPARTCYRGWQPRRRMLQLRKSKMSSRSAYCARLPALRSIFMSREMAPFACQFLTTANSFRSHGCDCCSFALAMRFRSRLGRIHQGPTRKKLARRRGRSGSGHAQFIAATILWTHAPFLKPKLRKSEMIISLLRSFGSLDATASYKHRAPDGAPDLQGFPTFEKLRLESAPRT